MSRIDLGHIGLFRALTRMADISGEAEEDLFCILQAKDVPALRAFVSNVREPMRSALLMLPDLYGDANVLVRALSLLPDANGVRNALNDLLHIARHLGDLPLSFDLADLRGYNYHTGLMFAAYCGASPTTVALGGRYNEVGRAFGRGRPATGFSLDLRELAAAGSNMQPGGAVLAPMGDDSALKDEIARLRAAGTVVMLELPDHEECWREAGCDRRLESQNGVWHLVPLQD
jgi:ATP phosphoribosyltransferase regulatory subunit